MALPALALPELLSAGDLPPEAAARLEPHRQEWERIRDEFRRARPEEGSREEVAAVVRFARFGLRAAVDVPGAWEQGLRGGLERTLQDLLAREVATAETERKLALRQLEKAVDTLGVAVEYVLGSLRRLDVAAMWQMLKVLATGPISLDAESVAVLRWSVDLGMALESLDAPVDELAYWARRAAMGARRVEATMARGALPGLRGELARMRARTAWDSWDEEEVERELRPWPTGGE